jgi:hypothetical protein
MLRWTIVGGKDSGFFCSLASESAIFLKIASKHGLSQNIKARELTF